MVRVFLSYCVFALLFVISSCTGRVSTSTEDDSTSTIDTVEEVVPSDTAVLFYDGYTEQVLEERMQKYDEYLYRVCDNKLRGTIVPPYFLFHGFRVNLCDYEKYAYVSILLDENNRRNLEREREDYHHKFKILDDYISFVLFQKVSKILSEYFMRNYTTQEKLFEDILNDRIDLDNILIEEGNSIRWLDNNYIFQSTNIHKYFKEGVKRTVKEDRGYSAIEYDE